MWTQYDRTDGGGGASAPAPAKQSSPKAAAAESSPRASVKRSAADAGDVGDGEQDGDNTVFTISDQVRATVNTQSFLT